MTDTQDAAAEKLAKLREQVGTLANITGAGSRESTFTLSGKRDEKIVFYPGLLLLYGPTRGGKSTTALSLVYAAALQKVSAAYRLIDEAGTQVDTPFTPIDAVSKKIVGNSVYFTEPTLSTGVIPPSKNINAYLRLFKGWMEAGSSRKMVVIDSIGSFLAGAAGLIDMPGQSKGMVEGYGAALRVLDAIARDAKVTTVGLVNEELFALKALEGSVDGRILMNGRGNISKRDRMDRGADVQFEIPSDAIELAVATLEPGKKADLTGPRKGIL